MTLELAAKKAYEKKYKGISGYEIDGRFVNLDCMAANDDTYAARIIFNNDGTSYHAESPYDDLDSITDFADEIKRNLHERD